jgi:peptidoglycan/xylan/chitin deacetylase (PgdA/CDA1 family)
VPVAATRNTKPLVPASSTPSPTADGATSSAVGSTPLPLPGFPEVVDRLPLYALPGAVALTIDDGFNPATVAAYVEFARASGVHLTFNPNGLYSHVWAPHAETLRPLIEAGQVQIGNHTYGHKNITKLSRRKLTSELESNDEWIQQTFGITSRPWFRPPFGFHNARTDSIAGELGYTKILMWNGSFGDSALLTPEMLLKQAHLWLRPGTIMLGHANHPVITHLFPQLLELIKSRELTPQTLDEAFGTSRALG